MLFKDRHEAGRKLGVQLKEYAGADAVVLALPRGGVPVGYEVARGLELPLDVFIVRKIGAPRQPELAVGALAPRDTVVLNEEMVRMLHIPRHEIEEVMNAERRELKRRMEVFRADRPFPDLLGKTVILVDDGLATGSTAQVAIEAIQKLRPARIVLAVPVAPVDTVEKLKPLVSELVCLETPEQFHAVGLWYDDFQQTTDEEVVSLLNKAWGYHPTPTG